MASIRRTLSPANRDRAHQNGETLFSASSPSQKLLQNSKQSSLFSSLIAASELPRYPPRKGQHGWRRVIYRCCFFFLIGLLLGLVPFGHVQDDIHSHDFSFEIKPVHVNVQSTNQSDDHAVNDNHSVVDPVDLPINPASEVNSSSDFVQKKHLIVVTPTYNRALQAYFLNRLSQVLRLVPPPLLWIVVETSSASMETAALLRKTGVVYRHLVCAKNLTNLKDRGVYQRNTALEHIEHHKLDAIVYFADDDNIYSVELFQSLRDISRFGIWPVAMLEESKNKAILEGPVCNGSQVIGWHTNEKSKRLRRFHVDMSGFAFNSTILWDPKRWRRPTSVRIQQLDTVKEGFQETSFVEQLVEDESQMESTPPGCSRIMNWHLHLEAPNIFYPRGWLLEKNLVTNLHFK